MYFDNERFCQVAVWFVINRIKSTDFSQEYKFVLFKCLPGKVDRKVLSPADDSLHSILAGRPLDQV